VPVGDQRLHFTGALAGLRLMALIDALGRFDQVE
jgi:hypothetical protein